MTILPIIAISAFVLIVAYLTYGRLVMRWLGTDASRPTPAVELEDGNDYVPAAAPVVLGGHFTAIAAAGPVVGPIVAGLAFGWLPALIWILAGAIFIGGVHDAGALLASIRHRAASITQVVRAHISPTAYFTFLAFVWISLVYVIIAFTDVTAGTFARFQNFDVVMDGQPATLGINGGAVMIGASAYLILSICLGALLRYTKTPLWIGLTAAVAIMAAVIWKAPVIAQWLAAQGLSFADTAGKNADSLKRGWDQALLIYCFIASIVPMWLLLQPRGVIGATFLYASLGFGIVGTLVGGWSTGSLSINYPAFVAYDSARLGPLFPFLFITIACGACSGFHSVVATGTTCKQVRTERDIKPIAYGAMLLEAMVAVFALSCVMVLAEAPTGATPDAIYARGIGNFMNLLGIDLRFAVGFGLLAFSSFVFDTLDVCTRLGRYVMQELLGVKSMAGATIATLLTLAGPSAYLLASRPGSFMTFWQIFGTSNQLLAALTLVGVSVWLWRTGRPVWFALLPAGFMLVSTFTALAMNFQRFYNEYIPAHAAPPMMNMIIAAVLFGLGLLVVIEAVRVWHKSRTAVAVTA